MIIKTDNNEYNFELVDTLEIEKEERTIEYKNKVNKYKIKYKSLVKSLSDFDIEKAENIEFCSFKLNTDKNKPGVYIWQIDGEIKYIGETKDLSKRFNSGYGQISPRNIFYKGQSTNCKMNRIALKSNEIKIYFYQTNEYKKVENELLEYNQKYNKWNLYNTKNK